MARCSICYEWFHKNCMSISKEVFSADDEHKNLNIVTTNCTVYNEALHILNFLVFLFFFFFFFAIADVLVFSNELLTTEFREYGNRRQKVFSKVVITKIVLSKTVIL